MSRAVSLRIGAFFGSSRAATRTPEFFSLAPPRLLSSSTNGKDEPSVLQVVTGAVRRVWYGNQLERDTIKQDVADADARGGLDWNDEAEYRQSVGLKAVGEEPAITAAQEQVPPPLTGNIHEVAGPESTFKHHALKNNSCMPTERQVEEEANEKVEPPDEDAVLKFRIKKNIF